MTRKKEDLIEAQVDSKYRKVQVELPVLDGYDAIRFVGLLSHIIDAVWATHFMEMNEILRERDPMRLRYLPRDPCLESPDDFPPLPLDDDDLPF